MLGKLYGDAYTNSTAAQNVSSIVFAGTVVGMLGFGYTSDHWSRKWSLMISTIILFIFAALGAGSYGAGGNIGGMFAALTAYRFFLGVGIGGEYPAGSVGAAENTGELKHGHRNRWFIMFTNFQIDAGFVGLYDLGFDLYRRPPAGLLACRFGTGCYSTYESHVSSTEDERTGGV